MAYVECRRYKYTANACTIFAFVKLQAFASFRTSAHYCFFIESHYDLNFSTQKFTTAKIIFVVPEYLIAKISLRVVFQSLVEFCLAYPILFPGLFWFHFCLHS